MKKKTIFFIIFSLIVSFLDAEFKDIVFPLVPEIISAIPLSEEEDHFFQLMENRDEFIVSIKENNVIHYWKFLKNSLSIEKLREFKNFINRRDANKKNYSLKINKGVLSFYLNGERVWRRKAPDLNIIDYGYNGEYLAVIFKNGLLNIFKKGGDLIFWKNISPDSFYVMPVRKGIFVFSKGKDYYYFDIKKKELKKGTFPLKLQGVPVVKENKVYIWGIKSKEQFFSIMKMYPKIGVWCKLEKNDYFKGETLKLELDIFNVEDVRTTIKTIINGKENLDYKRSKKKEFKIYLPFEGEIIVKILFEGKEYKKEKEVKIKVYDKDKIEKESFYELMDKIILNEVVNQ